jgi:predicted SnoaL-like aldol condensation-catalyzing enzyme
MTSKELVVAYMEQVWVGRDVAALDRFVAADLIQHNPHLPNGRQALGDFLPILFGQLMPGLVWRVLRVIAEGDLVAVHSHAAMPGSAGQVVVDIYRVANGLIVEHWDVAHEAPPTTASGNAVY